jgi:hypothetical protein
VSYLDEYGAGDERRGKIIKWAAAAVVVAAVAAFLLYHLLRNYREDRQVKAFSEMLQRKDYKGAYALWGCTETNPCRDYSFDKFLEDWGPQSRYANASQVEIGHPQQREGAVGAIRRFLGIGYSCEDGVIYELKAAGAEPVLLYVLRKDQTIGFAPWAVCAPRMHVP